MAKTENFCLEKRDIQRSSDGLQLSPSQWDVSVMCQNKSQCARVTKDGELFSNNHETSEKHPKGNYELESVNSLSKIRDPAVTSKFNETIECVLSGKLLNGGIFHRQNIKDLRNCCHIARTEADEDYTETLETHGYSQGRHVKKLSEKISVSATSRDANSRNGCLHTCKVETPVEFRVKYDGNGQSTHETRITSLRKLLKSPLHFGVSKFSTVSTDDDVNLLNSGLSAECCDSINSAACTSVTQSACPETVSTKEVVEENAMNRELTTNHKGLRKRSKAVENSLNSSGHDEVKEKIAELARTPRIKSLQEILESLHIKLDNKLFEQNGSSNSAHASDKSSLSETMSLGKRSSYTGLDTTHTCFNHISKFVHSRTSSNDCRRETLTNQPISNNDEHSSDSSKPIKVLISGEVSRKPKPSCLSQNTRSANSYSHRVSSDVYEEHNVWKVSDERHKRRHENGPVEQIRMHEKILKKKQKILARKREVNNTKELRAILQARTSYRKEISDLQSAPRSDVLQIPYKKPRGDTEIASSISQPEVPERHCNCQNCSSKGLTQCSSSGFNNANIVGCTTKDPNSTIKETIFNGAVSLENLLPAVNSNVSKSDADIVVDEVFTSDLSQLPSHDETEISSSESQDFGHKVAPGQETENVANEVYFENIEGRTGNYSYETPGRTFREWHETVLRPSYHGNPLILLPYVVID